MPRFRRPSSYFRPILIVKPRHVPPPPDRIADPHRAAARIAWRMARAPCRRTDDARCRAGRSDADFVGSSQPVPAVSRGARFPDPCRDAARPQHSGIRGCTGIAERRPRLGAQHGQPAVHRSGRPGQRALHPRQRQGKLPDADGTSGHRAADRRGPGRRDLCLVIRRWRRATAAIDPRLRRADQFPRPLRPPDGSRRRRLERTGRAFACRHPDHGARRSDRRARRFGRIRRGQPRPRDRAVGRGFLLSLLSRRRRDRSVLSAEPRRLQGRTGLRVPTSRCRPGSARARCGSIRHVTARSTATRPAPHWRWPRSIRISL